jgi:pectate lyase
VTRPGPLWITFAYSMTIKLKNELMITSYKTIHGRGVNVQIAGGAGFTLQYISNVIIHGVSIHDIKPTGPARIMTSTTHVGKRGRADGDAISIFTSKNLWVDHCYLARAADGLVDVIRGSTAVSITNNFFTQHNKVMLLGAHPNDYVDRNMYVTVAYNVFGPKLTQRMPRVRFGNVHVLNNDYTAGWGIYAVGGSEAPTILSQGNVFSASKGPKQVTKRINDGGSSYGGPKTWSWTSEGDKFLSGAFWTSVPMRWSSQSYSKTASCSARPASMVASMVRGAGPLNCRRGSRC